MPTERLELTGIEERVRFDRPMGFTREMRDETRACSPEQIAAQRIDYNSRKRREVYVYVFFFIPLCVRKWKDERKDEKGAPPSRGPRPFARNIRKFVGPPS